METNNLRSKEVDKVINSKLPLFISWGNTFTLSILLLGFYFLNLFTIQQKTKIKCLSSSFVYAEKNIYNLEINSFFYNDINFKVNTVDLNFKSKKNKIIKYHFKLLNLNYLENGNIKLKLFYPSELQDSIHNSKLLSNGSINFKEISFLSLIKTKF